jgi:DNA phosphorothioation-dependent restriction protein DptH
MLELSQANIRFLSDGFSEALGELAANRAGITLFSRLIDLAKMQRPLTALVTDSRQQLSATVKSFGLLHYLGREPSTHKSLAVQTLLREEESDDDGDIAEFIRPCEEKPIVERILRDYQQLYPAAEDGLRILAANVKELSEILAGVNSFLSTYLKDCSPEWPPFNCTVTIYSKSASPMAIESQLRMWRDHVLGSQRSLSARPLNLVVGHRYAPFDKIKELVQKESQPYDISFLFHFLRDDLSGRADPTLPFEYEFKGWSGLQFPIAEYPRPIRQARKYSRQSLLSNRRLRIQTSHADLSARLSYSHSADQDHLIYGEVDYQPWDPVVQALHERSHWVACVDPFIDKGLLANEDQGTNRKIVGFSSGLGAYGELNITLSTEQDTLKQLTEVVRGRLTRLLPFDPAVSFETIAARIVHEAEEIIGLASLRAVVGVDERIREVVGFAAIRRALPPPEHAISQLIPIDSLLHWYADSEVTQRPDLLHLAFEVREGEIPVVHAAVIECKLANKNPERLAKACSQVQDGLRHLTSLLAPARSDLDRVGFDRRYWWAQLHRAITSRAKVNISEQEMKKLDRALEQLTEGQFEVRWQGLVFTFWTNAEGMLPTITPIFMDRDVVSPPFNMPANFTMRHVEIGHDGLVSLFDNSRPANTVSLSHDTILLRSEALDPSFSSAASSTVTTSASSSEEIEDSHPQSKSDRPAGSAIRTSYDEDMTLTPIVTPQGDTQSQVDTLDVLAPTAAPRPLDIRTCPVPEKLLIGNKNNGDPVFWHYGHPQLANRHLLLFGSSGSGKTYGIQCLLAEMAQQRLHSFIVDYTDGFSPAQMELLFNAHALPKNHFVITEKLPLSPFRPQRQIIDPSIPAVEENNYQIATRIESIFSSVFELGGQQSASLIRAIQTGLEEDSAFGLGDILDRLRGEGNSGETLANKLEPFVRAEPFRDANSPAWGEMLSSDQHWVNILQLKGLAREIQKAVTEFTLWDLWDYAQNSGAKQRPIPIVLDEIQNLDHSSDSPIDKMLREGRKFGISLILATQTTSQFNAEQRDRLFQAGHKLFFKPATTEIDRFAQILSRAIGGTTKAEWATRLAKLEKGQCWSLGPVLRSDGSFREEAIFVSVTPLEKRFT